MAEVGPESMDIGENAGSLSAREKDCVPQQLKEANELLKSINRRLEDCSLEWKSEISKKQWTFLNTKQVGKSTICVGQSVLARTYFIDKDLDQAFQHLLSCNKIFSECLKNFIELLCGSREQMTGTCKETCDAQNQWMDPIENYVSPKDSLVEPLLSVSRRLTRTQSNDELVKRILATQDSFVDVIKAKEDFDSKFLGFKNVLHKTASTTTEECRCPYCSSVLATIRESRTLKNEIIENQKVVGKIRRRRAVRNSRFLSRKSKKPAVQHSGSGGDQLMITPRN